MDIYKNHLLIAKDVKLCNNFLSRARGLMFSRIKPILLDNRKESYLSIHMLFVFSSIRAVWIDDSNKIIKIEQLKPFALPVGVKARYVLELPVNSIELNVNDKLRFL